MGARQTVRAGQRRAKRDLVPGLVVTRTTKVTQDDYTTIDAEVTVYGGPDCPHKGLYKLQTYEPDAILLTSAGRPVITQEYRLHVPVDAGPFQIGDVAWVPGHARPFLIDGLIEKTYQTTQRLKVTVQSNAEVASNG